MPKLPLVVSSILLLCGCVSRGAPPADPAAAAEPVATAPAESEPAAAGPGCDALAGRWEIDGACGDDRCTIVQSSCAITEVSCSSGAQSTTGTIDGASFTYTGVSGAGAPATCTGTLAGSSISGTCTIAGAATCAFSGARD
jgi:hypothetical protein